MKPYVYVISDIHGQADLFDALLTDYDPVEHQLVLIGDLNDRGPHSKACFLKGKELVEQHGAVYLRGNHEEYFFAVSSKSRGLVCRICSQWWQGNN
ncbi:hypothetical protein EfsSVR2281_20640 [Enterococcus faecalis]|nr:hypothetical protein EfsSVR2281_20640 [Enterococcus faecalis]